MTTPQKIEKLKSFKNEREFREFLIDFLKKSGFTDIIHTHRYGSPEQGKDVIAKYPHSLEGDDWYAFVVKLGRIGGGTNEIETIKNQIKQSFEYPYVGINGERQKINKVKIVTNENFTGGAQSQIADSPELKIYNNFGFWWNENLIELIDKNYPDYWLPGDEFSKEYSKVFVKKLHEEIEIRELSLRKIDDKNVQKLLDIFIEPKLTTPIVEEDKKTKEKSVKIKHINVNSITRITENLLLSGEQGAGKSKVLNTIACNLSSAQSISDNKIIPVKLKAPQLRDINFNIDLAVENEIKLLSEQFYNETILQKYKVILFIDDLDLLRATEKDLIFENIKNYCTVNKTFYVLTYRKNEFESNKDLKTIRIHNFNLKQVEAFVTKFFEGSDRGSRFIQILRESDILSKLPTTPLTITLISLLYDENNFEIPATLSDIYNDFVSVLLGKLDIQNKTELLIFNLKRRLFTSLALKMQDENNFEISNDNFTTFINSFLSERGYEEQTQEELNDIIEKSGLLFKDDNDNIGFKQQAFVDFLSSLEIYHHKRETHYKFLVEKFNDINWQNTAIFYAGHSKELTGMIDDVITRSPNNTIKDWFINTGGMGYLAQALYQTLPSERKKLALKSLDNLLKCFNELIVLSKTKDSFVNDMPLPMIVAIINYWFRDNFKSITLKTTLSQAFEEIYSLEEGFENNLKLLVISSTMMSTYIGDDSYLIRLLDRKSFMDHPLLPLAADLLLDISNSNKTGGIATERREKLKKSLMKKKEFIKYILTQPAYKYNENFPLITEVSVPEKKELED